MGEYKFSSVRVDSVFLNKYMGFCEYNGKEYEN